MKKGTIGLFVIACLFNTRVVAQQLNTVIDKAETERIEKYLSSDALEGRRTFSKGIDKAADFIANEFKQAGLQTFNNTGSYLQKFTRTSVKFVSANASFDGNVIDPKNIIVVTASPSFSIDETSGYEIVKITKQI